MNYSMSENVEKGIKEAVDLARLKQVMVEPLHILYGLFSVNSSMCSQILRQSGLNRMNILMALDQINCDGQVYKSPMSESSIALMDNAKRIADITKQNQICSEHILLACVLYRNTSIYHFLDTQVNINSMLNILNGTLDVSSIVSGMKTYSTGKSTKNDLPKELSEIGIDFTEKARMGKVDPVIGRKEEIERIIQILCRKTKNNPVLIGEPGVGKTAVVEGLALEIVNGNVPDLLKNKMVFSLDVGSLVAGTKYRGELEGRLKGAIDAIIKHGNIIVFIDELHTLAQAGSRDGEVTPADMLKPYLARGILQTVGATTTTEYKKFIEKDTALERRFQPIVVEPPSIEQTIEILKGIRSTYESFHKIKITDDAIISAANLSDRYIVDRFLPDKAIDLIDEAASKAKVLGKKPPQELTRLETDLENIEAEIKLAIQHESFNRANMLKQQRDKILSMREIINMKWLESGAVKSHIDGNDIATVVAKWTKIPVTKLTESETDRLNNLEKLLGERVIGQDMAVTSIAKSIRRERAGLKDPNRPIGSFIFAGPTGVGKTELTKALADAMFDDANNIIRVDMSEYMEAHSVSKLIGAPPGYAGFEEGGQLTEKVRRNPYSVVLFDEIEKGHQDIYNLLLQTLDEGSLTDSQGRKVSFKNCIIIMTSNLGVSELKSKRQVGFYGEESSHSDEMVLENALKRHFSPEFFNRIDVVCYFKHLSEIDIRKIADIMMSKMLKKLAPRNISIALTESVKNYIITNGYDIEYGARPLRRILEQCIEDSIAESILQGRLPDNSTALIDLIDGEIVVQCERNI